MIFELTAIFNKLNYSSQAKLKLSDYSPYIQKPIGGIEMSTLDEELWGATFIRLAIGDVPTDHNELAKIEDLRTCSAEFLSELSSVIDGSWLNTKQKKLTWKWAYHILDMNQRIQSMVGNYTDSDVKADTLDEVRTVIIKLWLSHNLPYIGGVVLAIVLIYGFIN